MVLISCTNSHIATSKQNDLIQIKLKLSSFKSSDDINENENGPYRGFGYWIKRARETPQTCKKKNPAYVVLLEVACTLSNSLKVQQF